MFPSNLRLPSTIRLWTKLRLWLRPHLIGLHLLAIAAVVFCVFMGRWQLGVYDTEQAHERVDREHVPTVPMRDIWAADEPFTGVQNLRPVTVIGSFAPRTHQFWVRGKTEDGAKDGAQGYWLAAPFLVAGDAQGEKPTALVVVRGWSKTSGTLPVVPAGEQQIHVILQPGESGNGSIDEDRVAGAVRIPALINQMGYDLYAGFGISTSNSVSAGLMPVTPPEPESRWTTGLRNLLYGVQWFVFAAFAVFMWWRMATESVAIRRQQVA